MKQMKTIMEKRRTMSQEYLTSVVKALVPPKIRNPPLKQIFKARGAVDKVNEKWHGRSCLKYAKLMIIISKIPI